MPNQNGDSTVDGVVIKPTHDNPEVLKRVRRIDNIGEDQTDFDPNGDCIHHKNFYRIKDPRYKTT